MDRSGLGTGCTKTDRVRINGGRIKAVDTEIATLIFLVLLGFILLASFVV